MSTTAFDVPVGQRQLFLDDHGIAEINNLTRTMHRPAKKGAVIRPRWTAGEKGVYTRSAPIWDPEQAVFKFWAKGYRESRDGLHWTEPPPDHGDAAGRPRHMGFECVVYDPLDPDPSCRFKAFSHNHNRIYPMAGDGVTWRELECPPIPSWDEHNLSFDPVEKRFIATVKDAGHAGSFDGPRKEPGYATAGVKGQAGTGRYGRSVWLTTSADFRQWTQPELALESDDEDQALGGAKITRRFADPALEHPYLDIADTYNVDIYNMGVFRYEGLYIGMPSMYHQTGKVAGDWPGFKEWDCPTELLENFLRDGDWAGFMEVQLVSSRNLHEWQRLGDRQPFIESSPLGGGAYDLATIIGPSSPIVHDDELWFYYSGAKRSGGPPPATGVNHDGAAICLAVLRRDGFISLDGEEEEGTVLTQPLALPKGDLYVNVDARRGSVVVQVCDEHGEPMTRLEASEPITGDQPRAGIRFEAADWAGLESRAVSLRFTLRNASLYAYWIE